MNNVLWSKHYDPLLEPVPPGIIEEFILDGGRSGGKTQHIAITALDMVCDPFGGSFIASRANAVDLAGSVRESIIKKYVNPETQRIPYSRRKTHYHASSDKTQDLFPRL